jgi:hypothetical protein
VPAVRKRKERGKWGSIVEEKVKVKETRWELKRKKPLKHTGIVFESGLAVT